LHFGKTEIFFAGGAGQRRRIKAWVQVICPSARSSDGRVRGHQRYFHVSAWPANHWQVAGPHPKRHDALLRASRQCSADKGILTHWKPLGSGSGRSRGPARERHQHVKGETIEKPVRVTAEQKIKKKKMKQMEVQRRTARALETNKAPKRKIIRVLGGKF
jgi:hypothetical protein